MSHTCDVFCDCKTLNCTNCKTCGDTNCVRQGDKNYVCQGWCISLDKKVYDIRYACKKENVSMSAPRTCNNCYYKTMGLDAAYTCDSCIVPHVDKKNNWKSKLPEKKDNLTWFEADKLWHEGWDVRRDGYNLIVGDWDRNNWSSDSIRATDWYVAGRRDNVKDSE